MRTCLNRLFIFSALLFAPMALQAAERTVVAVPDKDSNTFNPVLLGLVSLIFVLLLAIGVIASALRQITLVYRDKFWAEKNKQAGIVKTVLLMLVFSIPALHSFAADAVAPAAAQAPSVIDGIPSEHFYVLMSVIALELLVVFALVIYMGMMVRMISNKPEIVKEAKSFMLRRSFWDRFHKAVAIEKEKDIMLDHDYDGIHELDNSLPPWWKYGFYLTIIVAIIYLYRYQVAHIAPNPEEEYAEEMRQADEQKTAYLAKSANNIDENTVKLSADPTDLAAGKLIFETTCFACHAKDGGGGVGPNLTDDYWLHGGGIKDIFKTIKYGYQDKGMKSWKDDYSPKQIAQIASYIKSLHGTKPAAPKDKQGDLYIDGGNTTIKTDSSKTIDTAKK